MGVEDGELESGAGFFLALEHRHLDFFRGHVRHVASLLVNVALRGGFPLA